MNGEELQLLFDKLRHMPKENQWLEFKHKNMNPEEVGKRISALSNGACLHDEHYGYLIFGVEDETRKILGTDKHLGNIKKGKEELEHWIHQRLNPRIDFRIFDFSRNGEKLSLIQIPATRSHPVRFTNESYIRIGSITRKLKEFPEKERKIWLSTSNQRFEKQIALAKISPKDLNGILNFNVYFELQNLPIPTRIDDKIRHFEDDNLIIKAGLRYNITNLGAILFAKDLRIFENLAGKAVRLITYGGKNRVDPKNEYPGKKGYALGFSPLINFIQAILPSNEVIKKSLRTEVKLYPKLALRELVANALIHQDFEISGSGPMIEIFSNRIEISNPGKPIIEVLRFIDNHPRSRNELLARLMRKLNICEERGSGIDKVIHRCEHQLLPPPDFVEGESFLRVTLHAPKKWKKMSSSDKIRACYQHCALKHVSGSSMTTKSLLKRFNLKESKLSEVSKIISDTLKKDLIKDIDNSEYNSKYIPFWG